MTDLPCARCRFAWVGPPAEDDVHCYMFKEEPSGCFCGQFREGTGLLPPARRSSQTQPDSGAT